MIFVTAFDRLAIRAVEIHALDYLLKPVNEARFNESLAPARAAVAGARDDSMIRRSLQMAAEVRVSTGEDLLPTTADRIPVKAQGRVVILRVAGIDWVEADGDYVSEDLPCRTRSQLLVFRRRRPLIYYDAPSKSYYISGRTSIEGGVRSLSHQIMMSEIDRPASEFERREFEIPRFLTDTR